MRSSYTHDHVDHVYGLDDLRLFPHYLGGPVPAYCEEQVEGRIRKSFDYAFVHENQSYGGGVPQIAFAASRPNRLRCSVSKSCRFV